MAAQRSALRAASAVACVGLLFGYGSGVKNGLHGRMFDVLVGGRAAAPPNLVPLVLAEADYPDIHKFRASIRGTANEERAHSDAWDPNTWYWQGNESQWETLLRQSKYPNRDFRAAYACIGNYVHLVQDSTVPAHNRIIFHGYPGVYRLAPGGPLLDATLYTEARFDNLEYAAQFYDFGSLPTSIATLEEFLKTLSNAPQPYNSSGEGCSNIRRKLWLCDAEAGAQTDNPGLCQADSLHRTWGLYSFPTARGCHFPPLGGDLDWYPRELTPDAAEVEAPQSAHEIGRTAVYLAIRLGSEALQRFSKALPPIVTGPTEPVTVSAGGAFAFALRVEENRTEQVFLSITDAAGRPVRNMTIRAPRATFSGVADGARPIPLTGQPDSDLSTLPRGDTLTLTWDGTLGDGSKLRSGRHALTYQVRDDDGNVTKGRVIIVNGVPGRQDSVRSGRPGRSR